MSEPEEKRSIRNIYALGLVSFFTDISSEMVFSVLPVFILGLPGSSPALTAAAIVGMLALLRGQKQGR